MTTLMTIDHENGPDADDAGSPLKRLLIGIGASILATFALGVAMGITARGIQVGFRPLTVALLVAAVLASALTAYVVARQFRRAWSQPMAARPRRASKLMMLSALVGIALGVVLSLATIDAEQPFALYSDDPVPALPAAIAIAIYLLAVPVITWRWWQSVDEHQLRAYHFGAIVGLYLYFFVTPAWWLGWRGGFLPEPRHMLVFCAVWLVWCLGWCWRRYR